MVIVEVDPGRKRVAAGGLVFVEAGVGSAVGEGPMKSFDLPVGLWPVGAGPFVLDVQFGAGVTPGMGAVAGAVVRQHPFDDDTSISEPGNCAVQGADRGDGLLVVADLDESPRVWWRV